MRGRTANVTSVRQRRSQRMALGGDGYSSYLMAKQPGSPTRETLWLSMLRVMIQPMMALAVDRVDIDRRSSVANERMFGD